MRILITGASGGIGSAAAIRFLEKGHQVFGIDRKTSEISHPNYSHFIADVCRESDLPILPDPEILFINAGTQNSADDIEVNLKGSIRTAEFYIRKNESLKSILFNASASSINGQEFPVYAASKAGLVGYMRNLAVRLAPRRITCNAISLGGVYTSINDPVMQDPSLWEKIMAVTPMKKWTDTEEIADWVEFLTVKNHSMSGENLLIDNGEYRLRSTFVWPEESDIVRLSSADPGST